MTKLIILDRDGVINQDSLSYIKSPDEFILIPGSIDAIVRLNKAGFHIGVATNQSGIARGLYTEEQLSAIHDKMLHCVNLAGGCIDIVKFCPHMPDSGCSCRKPGIGLLVAIAQYFDSSLDHVPFVGDRVSDMQAALTAGCHPIMVLSSMTDRLGLKAYPQIPVYLSLSNFVDDFLQSND